MCDDVGEEPFAIVTVERQCHLKLLALVNLRVSTEAQKARLDCQPSRVLIGKSKGGPSLYFMPNVVWIHHGRDGGRMGGE